MNDIGVSTQHCVQLIHLRRSRLSLIALPPKQSDPMSYAHKWLINRHLAYSTMCHTSKERLPGLLSTFTIKRSLSVWALLLASPFTCMLLSAQTLLGVCGPHRFSDPISLGSYKYLLVQKTERQESSQSWSLKMCTSGQAKPEQGQGFKVRVCWFLLKKRTQFFDVKKHQWGLN